MMQSKKYVLGITGGVGAGKSTVLEYLKRSRGALILECDRIAQRMQEPGGSCYEAMRRLFPDALLHQDGTFDRAGIAREVFKNPDKLARLNAIVHPQVKNYIKEILAEEKGDRLVVIEAALLLDDDGYSEICDEIWYIYASEEIRAQRLQESRGYTKEKSERIFAAQRSDESFRALCSLTIDNSGADVRDTFRQIDKGLTDHGFLFDCQRQLG